MGCSWAAFSVLQACAEGTEKGLAQNDLAAATGSSPAHISGLVEQMRRDGWLDGHRDPTDRRRQVWRLTPTGQAIWQAIVLELEPEARLWSELLDPDRRGRLNALIEMLPAQPGSETLPRREAA